MRKKRKKFYIVLVIFLLLIGSLGFSLFKPDHGVSSFVSIEGEQEFKEVYEEAMKGLPEPQNEKIISTSFGEVKVYTFLDSATANQAPLLILPGKAASTPMWEPNLIDFMSHRPVYTIDLIGEPGLSTETVKIKDEYDQATWLKEVIIALEEPQIHLLGLSFGGWNATNVIIQEELPQVQSLVLIDPIQVFGPIPLKMIAASIPASIPIIPQSIRERMLSYISGGAEVNEEEPVARLIETGMRTFKSKLPHPTQIRAEQLEEISVPVLAILADNSTMHNAEKSYSLAKESLMHQKSSVVLFSNASHALNGEYPEKLAETIQDFILTLE
ncbi:alpha/beta fold hydrolase [Bacillus horti]|uniref:Pimeloyl-ACP methyl ester carboxylesterase n=2 Tax=Caldalkalibacillus horti TaxID=77523 RepID=A0ABT9W5U3_9BACI|nr:alpha/beta hydrolase [Bacillus horti]MDQ0168439.1 pimeloyl-ACP methyl ester carboxylesterase [Bacillus horti]